MTNPFAGRASSLQGPPTDIQPVTPDDSANLPKVAIGLYVETGGTLAILTVAGQERSIEVPDFTIVPIGVRRVLATGTTADGIHALVL